jgi:hypothetical protein
MSYGAYSQVHNKQTRRNSFLAFQVGVTCGSAGFNFAGPLRLSFSTGTAHRTSRQRRSGSRVCGIKLAYDPSGPLRQRLR